MSRAARRPVAQRVLLTGFEPFGGDALNPSWEAVRALAGWRFGDGDHDTVVHTRRIACVFGRALEELNAAIDELQPQLVIGVGLAGGRAEVTPERIAIDVDDARIGDNAGCQPIDQPVIAGAPAAYFSTLPIKAMVAALRAAGIPASVSNSAGTFVCNHLFFGLMHRAAHTPGLRAGFVHVPYLSEQAAALSTPDAPVPGLALATIEQALRIAVQVAATRRDDLRMAGGALH